MKKFFLIIVFVGSLVGCAGNHYFMESALFRRHMVHSIEQADKISTRGLDVTEQFAVLHRPLDHHQYSRQGLLAALLSYTNFDAAGPTLSSDQLAGLDYQLLTAWHSDQLNFRLEYDERLDCAQSWLKLNGQDYALENYFPHKLLQQMQLQYDVTVRLVASKSFYNVHLIDPERGDLVFYRMLDCQAPPTMDWYTGLIEIIVHEITHLEQIWIHSGYRTAVLLPYNGGEGLDYYKLLGELIANKVGQCSHIVNKAFHWTRLSAPTELGGFADEDHHRQSDSLVRGEPVAYSSVGWSLASSWMRSYADDDGYIRRADRAQYNTVVNACQTILTDDGIHRAGMHLMNELGI